MIDSACKCGEPVLIETGRYDLCRRDGKRPHYPESSNRTTVLRCRSCSGWLGDTCSAAAFDDSPTPPDPTPQEVPDGGR